MKKETGDKNGDMKGRLVFGRLRVPRSFYLDAHDLSLARRWGDTVLEWG